MSTSQSRYSNRGTKPKLLVVDDEPDNLDLLYRTFYRQFQVLRAERGRQALEILAAQPDIAVIISDQRMPEMAGTELLGQAAQRYPDVMRIILTGYTDSEDLVEAINQGKVFKYVTKPWDEDDLRVTVQQALDAHNLIKARTADLNRVLRQETLLNTITNRIRSAQTPQEMLQTIVDVVGRSLEVSYCSIKPYCDESSVEACFTYQATSVQPLGSEERELLSQTLWPTDAVLALESVSTDLLKQVPDAQDRLLAFESLGIQSSVLIPLISRQDLVAVMALHRCSTDGAWADDDMQLLATLADQAALALSQAYTYQRVQALARRETLINTITSAIRSSLNPHKTFAAITWQLGQALQVDGCALSLWTEQDDYVRCVGLYDAQASGPTDMGEEPENEQLPESQVLIAGNPVLQRLIASRQPVVVHSSEHQPLLAQPDLPLQNPAKALLVAPLVADGEIIGSISLRQVHQTRTWLAEEIELVKVVASQAAIAVQQARLFQTTKANERRIAELNQYLTESVLKRFLPESLVKKAAQGDLQLDLQPEPRLVTILFTDIVGFTELSNQLGPGRIAKLLNEYLDVMITAIFEYGGTVDKFMGDGILAMFGAPEDLGAEMQVQRAIASVLRMHEQLNELNQRWNLQGVPPVRFRCGIHTGIAVVGMFGSADRTDFTAIGPTVNMAARLQEAATPNGILVSEEVAQYLDRSMVVDSHPVHLKGIAESVMAMSIRSDLKSEAIASLVRPRAIAASASPGESSA